MKEIRLYTVAQVRDWLERNMEAEGLSKEVIRPALAWALIHNPFVQDEDPIVASIYDEGVLAASTCAFPELLVKPEHNRIWWFPMLWVKPEYRGKAYGLIVIGSLAEIYGTENAWTAWGVEEATEIFEYLGCKTSYFPQYFFEQKTINTDSVKGQLAMLKQKYISRWHTMKKKQLPNYDYQLCYMINCDDETYQFIQQHIGNHKLVHSQEMLNWNLLYPKYCSMPLQARVCDECEFFADKFALVQNLFVQVRKEHRLIGVYQLSHSDSDLSCDNLYYESDEAEVVFASIIDHIRQMKIESFNTGDKSLAEYVGKYVYFPKKRVEQISLSVSKDVEL